MKKEEVKRIFWDFVECLPSDCIKPEAIRIHGCWRQMVKEAWGWWIRNEVEHSSGIVLGDFEIAGSFEKVFCYPHSYPGINPYHRTERLHKIHGSEKKRHRLTAPYVAFAGDRRCALMIHIYSRAYRKEVDVIIDLLHEVGHFNTSAEDCPIKGRRGKLIPRDIAIELATEEWTWRRWPYVYNKYKKLKKKRRR